MRSKVTIVLLFLNVVLFYYIFHYEKPRLDERAVMEARKKVYARKLPRSIPSPGQKRAAQR